MMTPGTGTFRFRIVLFAVAAVMVAASAALAAAPKHQGPRIYVAEPRFDFGRVTEGDRPEHIFEVKNVGDEVLVIQQVRPS